MIDGERSISIEPNNDSLEVISIKLQKSNYWKTKKYINFDKDDIDDVSESRTFCLYKDIEEIKKAGLAKGGSLENALVVDEDKVLNEGGLRNEKEFVNHKILDLAGDFLLSGYRILGKVKCYQGGYELTNMFLRKMLVSDSVVTTDEKASPKIAKKYNQVHSTKLAVNAILIFYI